MPYEMIEFFMNPSVKITAEQGRIIWFLIRRLQGWAFKEAAIRTLEFVEATGLDRSNVTKDIKDLLAKKIIKRRSGVNRIYGEHIYSFVEETFGRVHATNVVQIDRKTREKSVGNLTLPVRADYPQECGPSTPTGEGDSTTENDCLEATRLGLQVPKETLKRQKEILKESKETKVSPEEETEGAKNARAIREMLEARIHRIAR